MARQKDISLTQLRYFIASAEYGTMTDAAASLFIAQSAVSTAVTNLEAAIGTTLFTRHRAKGLQLTSAGEEFLSRARRILLEVDDAMTSFSADSLSGPLTAGIFTTIAPFYAPAVLDELDRTHPRLTPRLLELSADGIEEALQTRAAEAALTYDLGLSPAMHRETLRTIDLTVALPPGHPLAVQSHVSLRDLASEPFILLDLPISRDYFLDAFRRHGLEPNIAQGFGSVEAVRSMVARGRGFTLLNQRPRHNLTYDGNRLVTRPLVEKVEGLDIVLASAEPLERLSRRSRAFAAACRAALAT